VARESTSPPSHSVWLRSTATFCSRADAKVTSRQKIIPIHQAARKLDEQSSKIMRPAPHRAQNNETCGQVAINKSPSYEIPPGAFRHKAKPQRTLGAWGWRLFARRLPRPKLIICPCAAIRANGINCSRRCGTLQRR
jgi:hypothetical protein